jgi:POT family proton-dependent oligopeptide transporter
VTARIAGTGLSVTAFPMFFFAGFALLAALAFALYARSYGVRDYYRADAADPADEGIGRAPVFAVQKS